VNECKPLFLDQLTVFDRYSYDIGGHAYSGNDIENGVLRGRGLHSSASQVNLSCFRHSTHPLNA